MREERMGGEAANTLTYLPPKNIHFQEVFKKRIV